MAYMNSDNNNLNPKQGLNTFASDEIPVSKRSGMAEKLPTPLSRAKRADTNPILNVFYKHSLYVLFVFTLIIF